MLKKAATSCLTAKDVKQLQFEPFIEDHELDIFPKYAGFKLPYFTLEGKVDPAIYRFRFLQTKPSRGFAAIAEEPVKPRRYTQPTGTNCGVYLPPILPDKQSWASIAKDVAVSVVITEGELKAACACKLGIPSIGLGGVYNWRSAKEGHELLPILEKFVWMARIVYVAFDSDSKDNPMVRMAASRLAYTLAQRGAVVRLVDLPATPDGTKQGIDDFIYSLGEEQGHEEFGKLLMEAEDIGPSKELHRLNDEVGIVRSTAEIVEVRTGNVYSESAFSNTRYRNRFYGELDANGKMIHKFAAKEWLAWEHRTEFTHFEYDPACNNIITKNGAYNTWYSQKWPLVPSKKGSIQLWDKLFNHVFSKLTDAQRLWVKRWFAYPLQHPGTKLYTAVLVWGRTTGTGKSRIGETMELVYGKNYGLITNEHLTASFNEWAESKQFIVGDEISVGDKRGTGNKLKTLLTQPHFRLNVKNRKSYTVRDCINYYFSSNHEDAVYLERHDRRFFVVHADIDKLEAAFYTDYMTWLNNGGAERLFYHLLYEVELGDFNPHGEAPMTEAKMAMQATGLSDVEDWAFQLKVDPDSQVGERNPYDLYTAKELLKFYDPEEKSRIKSNGISRALNLAGVFKCANGSNHVKLLTGARDTVYAIRNAERYRRMGPTEISKCYAAERESGAGKAKFDGSGRRLVQ